MFNHGGTSGSISARKRASESAAVRASAEGKSPFFPERNFHPFFSGSFCREARRNKAENSVLPDRPDSSGKAGGFSAAHGGKGQQFLHMDSADVFQAPSRHHAPDTLPQDSLPDQRIFPEKAVKKQNLRPVFRPASDHFPRSLRRLAGKIILCLPQLLRSQGNVLRSPAVQGFQLRKNAEADPVPGNLPVLIGPVRTERNALLHQEKFDFPAPCPDQRPDQENLPALPAFLTETADRTDPAQPSQAAPPGQVPQNRLRLIIQVMRDRNLICPPLSGGFQENAVSLLPRRLLRPLAQRFRKIGDPDMFDGKRNLQPGAQLTDKSAV